MQIKIIPEIYDKFYSPLGRLTIIRQESETKFIAVCGVSPESEIELDFGKIEWDFEPANKVPSRIFATMKLPNGTECKAEYLFH